MPCTSLRQVNRRKSEGKSSEFFGVHWHEKNRYSKKRGHYKEGRWRALIRDKGKIRYIGEFIDEAKASEAYLEAAKTIYGQSIRDGNVDYSNDRFSHELKKRKAKVIRLNDNPNENKVLGTTHTHKDEVRAIDEQSIALFNKLSMTEVKFFDAIVLLRLAYRELTLLNKGYTDMLNPKIRGMIGGYVNTTGKEMGDYFNEKLNGKTTNTRAI